jgi:hypothetical protein
MISEQYTIRAARSQYFETNGFGADGGYEASWVKLRFGPFTLAFPNTEARRRAVRYHDIHHVVSGYATSWLGEAEIGAWELASGCRSFVAAWYLNLGAFLVGLGLGPAAVLRAFVRGLHTRNLYGVELDDELLTRSVGAMRCELGLDREIPVPTLRDRLLLAGYAGLAALVLFGPLALVASLLVPWVIAG